MRCPPLTTSAIERRSERLQCALTRRPATYLMDIVTASGGGVSTNVEQLPRALSLMLGLGYRPVNRCQCCACPPRSAIASGGMHLATRSSWPKRSCTHLLSNSCHQIRSPAMGLLYFVRVDKPIQRPRSSLTNSAYLPAQTDGNS